MLLRSMVLAAAALFLMPTIGHSMSKDMTYHHCPPYTGRQVGGPLPETPNHEQIRKWWFPGRNWKQCKELTIDRIEPVALESGEQAFLCSVGFPDRARLFLAGSLLVRPNLQAATELDVVFEDFDIYDLDGDGISEVVTWGCGLGQGQTACRRNILRIRGWDPVILYQRQFGDNLGACGQEMMGRNCRSLEVYWSFADLNGDNKIDLLELLVYKEGPDTDQLKWRTETKAYLLKDGKFVQASPDLE